MKVVGLFPGQGSQSVGMGSEFFNSSESVKELFSEADKSLGFSLSELCFNGPIEELTLTKNAQPAILVTSFAAFQLAGLKLSAGAGHSLGEYTALVAAGVITFSDAVNLVHKRGSYMQEAVPAGEGAMVAVMGPSEEEISSVISQVESGVCEIANLNSPGQTVVAGSSAGIESFSEKMKEAGGKVIPLNVSAPFHCSLMQPAAEKLAADLDAITFNDPSFPIYANYSAEAVNAGDQARELLKKQVCGSVRWTDSIQKLFAEVTPTHTVEFGAGGVLSKLQKRIDKSATILQIDKPESLEKVKEALA